MTTWPATKAKAQLSAVMDKAETEGPQRLTRRGKKTLMLVTEEAWEERNTSGEPLGWMLLNSPLKGSGLDLPKRKWKSRSVKF